MNRILKGDIATQKAGAAGVFQNFDLLPAEEKPSGPADPELPSQEEILLSEAAREADAMLERARRESEQIRREAYEKGYEQGLQEGTEAGFEKAREDEMLAFEQQIRALEEKIAQYVADVQIEKEAILEQYLDDLKNIALAIGEKIVQASLKSSSEVVKKMILAATEKLKKTAWAKIYVAKTNDEMEIQGDAQFLSRLSRISDNVKIIVMEDAEPGACIIEFPQEIIDVSVGTQMENIREILNNARL